MDHLDLESMNTEALNDPVLLQDETQRSFHGQR